jgi:hypothetical protein
MEGVMNLRRDKIFSDNLLLGGLIVAAGTASSLWLPLSLAVLLYGVALCRICWIEDNIHHDLLTTDRVPDGYRLCRTRRQSLFGRAFADSLNDTDCARLLASQLRIQSHAWGAFTWGLVAGGILGASAAPIAVAAGIVTFGLALRQADYFAWGQCRLLTTGAPLPAAHIAGRGGLGQFAISSRRSG